ncbi:MAG: hypothetical protein M1514_03605 [Patescibacteria group bacterium]|nr:hypothetical protein [Patescibacteria group bacterium]
MRKILISLLVIGVLVTSTAGATSAYFSDSVTLTGVTVASGNANLKINNLGSSGWIEALTLNYRTEWATRWDAGGWFRDYFSGENPVEWYPGLQIGDGFYLGNFSLSRIGLNPVISLLNYTESKTNMQDYFLLKITGGGTDSGWQTLRWWGTHPLTLPTIAWCASPSWSTCGTMGVEATLKMDTAADNTMADGTLSFDLKVDATQAH